MIIKGKVHKFGNDVNTDDIISAKYLVSTDPKELGSHCMESIAPDFVKNAAIDAIKKYGVGASASRLISGTTVLHKKLEEKIAEFKGDLNKAIINYKEAINERNRQQKDDYKEARLALARILSKKDLPRIRRL